MPSQASASPYGFTAERDPVPTHQFAVPPLRGDRRDFPGPWLCLPRKSLLKKMLSSPDCSPCFRGPLAPKTRSLCDFRQGKHSTVGLRSVSPVLSEGGCPCGHPIGDTV